MRAATLTLTLTALMALLASSASATIIAQDDFSYGDGKLSGNGSTEGGWNGSWLFHSNDVVEVANGSLRSPVAGATGDTERSLDASAAAYTNGGPENDGSSVYIGIDWQFGPFYSGLQLTNGGRAGGDFNVQLGTQGGGIAELTTLGAQSGPDDIGFTTTSSVKRYVIQIDYDNTNGDSVTLYEDGVSLGTRANVGDLSFDSVGFGVYVDNSGQLIHADNLVIATTYEAAIVPEPASVMLLGLAGLTLVGACRRR